MLDVDRCLERLLRCELLSEGEVRLLCEKAKEVLMKESNIQRVEAPVTICGNIHGQYYDVKDVLSLCDNLPKRNFLFLGGIVNRGFYSLEMFLMLLCLKIKYPDSVTLLRSNHESRAVSMVYGLYDESVDKYGSMNVWNYCTDVFDYFPLGAVIGDRYFCTHGGLSPSLPTIDDMRSIDRKQEVPQEGPMCDLMWSDPEEMEGWGANPRGAGFLFGGDVVRQFCHENGVETIARAHQLDMEGYKWWFDKMLVTVWSAPNYCYRCGNSASIMNLDSQLNCSIEKFDAVPMSQRVIPPHLFVPDYLL